MEGKTRLACTDDSGNGLSEYPCSRIWDRDIIMIETAKHKRIKWFAKERSPVRVLVDFA